MSVTTFARLSADPFQTWLDRGQATLGDALTGGGAADQLVAMARDMPRAYTKAQRACAQGLLTRLLCRTAALRPPPSALVARLFELLARDLDERWREEWTAMVVDLLATDDGQGPLATACGAVRDRRVARALAEIERRYAEPGFALQRVARDLALSACRLTQLLKAETGRTFGAHVQCRRIERAMALLAEPTLTIKEIAWRVGYRTTTQLERQFKRHTSRLPSAYRRSLSPTVSVLAPPRTRLRAARRRHFGRRNNRSAE
jgi:AraC-like DNA-binding protein